MPATEILSSESVCDYPQRLLRTGDHRIGHSGLQFGRQFRKEDVNDLIAAQIEHLGSFCHAQCVGFAEIGPTVSFMHPVDHHVLLRTTKVSLNACHRLNMWQTSPYRAAAPVTS